MPRPRKDTADRHVPITVTLPGRVVAAIDRYVTEHETSRSALVLKLLDQAGLLTLEPSPRNGAAAECQHPRDKQSSILGGTARRCECGQITKDHGATWRMP